MGKLLLATYAAVILLFAGIAFLDQPRLAPETVSTLPSFDPDRALDHLQRIDELTRQGGGRAAGSAGHGRVIAYISEAFRNAGLESRVERFDDAFGSGMVNVIAELPGSSEEIVILSAHHDAPGAGPAAVEGMAGMAVLLESARALRASRLSASVGGSAGRPTRTVLFVSWDGEALGCAGSTHFVERSGAAILDRVRAVISLDSIGWEKGVPVVHNPRYFDLTGKDHIAPDWLVWKVVRSARRAGVSAPLGDRYLSLLYQISNRLFPLGYYSNDRPFLLAGIPGVFISDFSLTRFYPYYGSRQDTVDRVGRAPLGRAGSIATAAVRDLADSEVLPHGETDYLLVPTPLGWVRLTARHLTQIGLLMVLPGLVLVSGNARRRAGMLPLVAHLLMSAIFLIGLLRFDPIVFTVVAGPAMLATPLLALRHRGGVYGFWAGLIPPIVCAFLFVPVMAGGTGGRMILSGAGITALCALTLVGMSVAGIRGWTLRAETVSRNAT